MAYRDIDVCPNKETSAVLKEVKKFAVEFMRPAGIALDQLASPAQALQDDSPLWEMFSRYRKLDLHALDIPEEQGGLGKADWMTSTLIAETLGYGDAGLAVSLVSAGLPFQCAARLDVKKVKEILTSYCESGDCPTIACTYLSCLNFMQDHSSRNGSDKLPVTATPDKGKYVLNGTTPPLPNAPFATHVFLEFTINLKNSPPRTALAVIPLDSPGVSRKAPLDVSGQRSLLRAALEFKDLKITKGNILTDEDAVLKGLHKDYVVRLNQCLGLVFCGLAMSAFDQTLEYSRGRIQGGVPIFSHKNIKLQFFKMFKMIEAARANARRLACHYHDCSVECSLAHALAAKCLSTETAVMAASEAIQILGGYGLTREFPMEKLFRDAHAAMIEHGVNQDLALEAMECFK
ncbi:MAG: acyl-CoA/acyl-ACP dehydrogenase [Desulfatibacillum sp.]|nr:acyl-CoA/acyl-ACP dehydrogenase [Desulfatibacillum sp.]